MGGVNGDGSRPRRRSPAFVDRKEVKEVLGIVGNRTLDRYIKEGWCPPPTRWLTPTRPVWDRKAWDRWLRRGVQDAVE